MIDDERLCDGCCRAEECYKGMRPDEEEDMIKLKPCPFCGSHDVVFKEVQMPYNHVLMRIECCHCYAQFSVPFGLSLYTPQSVKWNENEVRLGKKFTADAWNSRVLNPNIF